LAASINNVIKKLKFTMLDPDPGGEMNADPDRKHRYIVWNVIMKGHRYAPGFDELSIESSSHPLALVVLWLTGQQGTN